MGKDLEGFVARSLERGASKQEIEATLLEAGWPRDEVSDALAAWADVEFAVPVPRPRPYLSAREAFLYLVLFTTLYIFAFAWGKLLFELVHWGFPDPSVDRAWQSPVRAARWAISSLVVAFPAYFWLSRRSYLSVRDNPAERASKVRKWLTYLTLFVTAAVLLGDLIVLVDRALGGELTVRFTLKVLIVGGIAGGVFAFYLWLLRQDDKDPSELPARHRGVRTAAVATVVGVLASILAGFALVGSPASARSAALDERRVQDLQVVGAAVDRFWERERRLPATLSEVPELGLTPDVRIDPASGQPYAYRALEGRAYELCATFDTTTGERTRHVIVAGRVWLHPAGRHCFELQAPG